jgi:hypothetical protein
MSSSPQMESQNKMGVPYRTSVKNKVLQLKFNIEPLITLAQKLGHRYHQTDDPIGVVIELTDKLTMEMTVVPTGENELDLDT